MIALAAEAIVECREHKPASVREYPQFSIAFGSRSYRAPSIGST
jgi:hypothetical protein